MAERKIIWTETASHQLHHILEYWKGRNKTISYSLKLLNKIEAATTQLKRYPESGFETNFRETRMRALGHYSIFYKHSKDTITIMAFWDNRQSPERLNKLLKK